MSYLARCPAGVVLLEDSADDNRFILVNSEFAGLAGHQTIAVGTTTGMATRTDDTRQAAACLVRESVKLSERDVNDSALVPRLISERGVNDSTLA
jgi:hypothetical protein